MKVSKKASYVASKYLEPEYVKGSRRNKLRDDLDVMGVNVSDWLDEATVRDIAIVVSRRILDSNGVLDV